MSDPTASRQPYPGLRPFKREETDLFFGREDCIDSLIDVLSRRQGDTVIVSEEVGLGVHPSTEVGRAFRDVLGDVNRAVAEVADEVLLVVAGRVLPLDPMPELAIPILLAVRV